jgi:hypothetical protein
MRRFVFAPPLALLLACNPGKVEPTTTTDASSGETLGMSSVGPGDTTGGPGTTPGTNPTTGDETSPPEPSSTTSTSTTSPDVTTTTTPDTTAGTTDGEECVIEPPPPGACDGGKPFTPPTLPKQTAPRSPLSYIPWHNFADAPPEPVFASTGDTDETTGCAFICPPDMGDTQECDLFEQNCAPGEKCNAWANDGGSSWNSTKCVPVDADPDQVGEPCTVEGSGVSGIDSCDKGAMCWGVDANNEGTCVSLCTCSLDNPICEVANTTCIISNEASLVLCLPVCDPLDADDCPADEVCLQNPSGELFICVIDASGEAGKQGDPCEFANACDPGFFCGDGDALGCGGAGCCSSYCALSNPACPDGLDCVPWFEQGAAPTCFEDLGACLPG